MAVLEFARQGGAAIYNVQSVVSFHGILSTVVAEGVENAYSPTRVAVYHGAADSTVTLADVDALRGNLEATGTHWEVVIYAHASTALPTRWREKITLSTMNTQNSAPGWL